MVLSTKEFVLPPETEDEEQLIAQYIGPHPHEWGRAYAYFPDYGPSVATIIRSLRWVHGTVEETAASWRIPEDAVRAAIGFYRQNRDYIDARIMLEDDDWNSQFLGPDGRPLP
jgi:hypothetical protein